MLVFYVYTKYLLSYQIVTECVIFWVNSDKTISDNSDKVILRCVVDLNIKRELFLVFLTCPRMIRPELCHFLSLVTICCIITGDMNMIDFRP